MTDTTNAPHGPALAGKRAVITGGSRGIGRAEALALAAAGVRLVINYSRGSSAATRLVEEIAAAGGEAYAVKADMAEPAQIGELMDTAAKTLGGIDILCSNAGIEHFGALTEVAPEDFDRVFAVNTRGQFFAVARASEHMSDGGRIVCTSSVSATTPFAEHAIYSGSKAAVEGMVRCLALDLAPKGITINAIAPGGTYSDMADEYAHRYGAYVAADRLPFGRMAYPEDIAKVVRFLTAPDSGWITGQTIRIAGGQ